MNVLHRISKEESKFYIQLPPGNVHRAIAYTLTPIEEGWERVEYYGESIFDPTGSIRKPEWVYVLVNRDIPGVCKIGMTTTSVEQRVREINSATGVISPWFPVYKYKCVNSRYLERDVHSYLEQKGFRANPNREGFYIDSRTAQEVIELLGIRYQVYGTGSQE